MVRSLLRNLSLVLCLSVATQGVFAHDVQACEAEDTQVQKVGVLNRVKKAAKAFDIELSDRGAAVVTVVGAVVTVAVVYQGGKLAISGFSVVKSGAGNAISTIKSKGFSVALKDGASVAYEATVNGASTVFSYVSYPFVWMASKLAGKSAATEAPAAKAEPAGATGAEPAGATGAEPAGATQA